MTSNVKSAALVLLLAATVLLTGCAAKRQTVTFIIPDGIEGPLFVVEPSSARDDVEYLKGAEVKIRLDGRLTVNEKLYPDGWRKMYVDQGGEVREIFTDPTLSPNPEEQTVWINLATSTMFFYPDHVYYFLFFGTAEEYSRYINSDYKQYNDLMDALEDAGHDIDRQGWDFPDEY